MAKEIEKRVPKLRFKGFTDDWKQRKLGEIADIVGGGTPNTNNDSYWDGEINWFAPAEINEQIYVKSSKKKITELGLRKSSAKKLPPGTVLFTSRAGIGKMAILTEESTTNQGFQSIVPIKNILDSYFIFSRTKELKRYGERMGSGSTFVEISGKQMEQMPIRIPNIIEQKEISLFFIKLDKTLTLHQRKLAQLEKLKQALLQQMFPKKDETVPKLRFANFNEDWKQRKLGELGESKSGIGFPDEEQGGKKGIPFFKVSDMNNIGNEHEMKNSNNYVDTEQLKKRNWKPIMNVPAVIFAKVGAAIMLNRKRIVRTPFLLDNNTMAYIFGDSWNSDFGKILFETIYLPRYAQVGALPSYNSSDINSIKVFIPNKNEQEIIGVFFKELDNLITVHHHRLDQLKSLKKELLQQMFI
ncbi:restriction endonuclease subunit S [Aerococcus urinaeequi]